MNFPSSRLLPSRWPDSLSFLPPTSTTFPDLPSVLFRDRPVPSCRPLRRNAFISSPLHARSSADLVDRTVQLLRGISDHFLMKYSRSTTKSSFVSQHHIFVFLLLSPSLSRERALHCRTLSASWPISFCTPTTF